MEEGRTIPKPERSNHGRRWFRGKKLGAGAFGSVHYAFFPPENRFSSEYFRHFPRIAAVKSAPHSKAAELYWEKKVYDALSDCPFIVECLGDDVTANGDKEGDMIYNVFLEYSPVGSLLDFMKSCENSGRLLEGQARGFARSILGGIERIHSQGLVHCDIKLGNVLLFDNSDADKTAPEFVAKVADLGLAKRIDQEENLHRLQGTPIYWAPEVVRDGVQGQPADIWALGCVVLEMLTGKLPWDHHGARTHVDLVRVMAKESPNLPRGMFSDAAESFVRLCCQSDPTMRPTAADQLRHPFLVGDGETRIRTLLMDPTIGNNNNDHVNLAPAWMVKQQQHHHHRQVIINHCD